MIRSKILRPTMIRTQFVLLRTIALCALSATARGADEQPSGASHPRHVAVPAVATTTEFGPAMMQSMARMDSAMQAAPMTGDPDRDFAAMMIPHHQGAVDMAEALLLHGKDPALRRLAHEIIVTQQQEIQVMRLRLAALQSPAPAARKAAATRRAGVPVSSRDRVYVAEQTSNTVSVIDPAANKLLGVIRLGDPVPGALSPLYKGQLLVHGMGFSPDHRTLAVVSIGSNSVTLIDTATNRVKGVIYVGRSPHEAFFTPNGREVWATVRGENYVSVIDPVKLWLVGSPAPPYGEKQPLARFTANVSGAQIAQAIGPFRQVVTGERAAAGDERRFLLVTKANSAEPVLVQAPGSLASRP